MKLEDRVNKLSKKNNYENNFSTNMERYFVSTLWLSSKMIKIKSSKLHEFMLQIIYPFHKRKYPGLSFSYLMIDDSLRQEVNDILTENGLNAELLNLDEYKNIEIADDLIISVHSRSSIVHKHLIININMLQISFSQIGVSYMDGNAYEENFRKYYIERLISSIDEFASSSRSTLLASYYTFEGGGYNISNNLIINKMNLNVKYEEIEKRIIDVNEIPNTSSLNILTGNGFSKYLTSKYLDDNWLVKQKLFTDFVPEFNNRLIEIKNIIMKSVVSQNNLDEEIKDRLKSYLNYKHNEQVEYIKSSKIIVDYVTYAEKFLSIQLIILSKIENGEINSVNDRKFYDMLDELNIIGFNHKERKTLFHSLIYVHSEDIFSNIECCLTIIDKFTMGDMSYHPKIINNIISKKDIENQFSNSKVNTHFILNYIYPEVYIEHVWNYGKINSLKWENQIISAKKVFTLNYDNITDKIFGKSIHLHGSFDKIYAWNDKNNNHSSNNDLYLKNISLKDERYFKQIYPNRQSFVLKGGDYKMEHIYKAASGNGDLLINSMREFSNQEGDFLVIGTLIVGDPHIIDLLGNKKRTVYITYYDESEFSKLYDLLALSKITGRKCNYKFVNFKFLMNYLKI